MQTKIEVKVLFTPENIAAVKEVAKRRGLMLSTFIRTIILRELQNEARENATRNSSTI